MTKHEWPSWSLGGTYHNSAPRCSRIVNAAPWQPPAHFHFYNSIIRFYNSISRCKKRMYRLLSLLQENTTCSELSAFTLIFHCQAHKLILVKYVPRLRAASFCNELSVIFWFCAVFRVMMLRVSVLRSCGVLLCVVNTPSGKCAVLSTCIVVVTYRVL